MTEDSAFWDHGGVDFQQMKESMEVNLERMEFARGASTITQQLAKNLYLSPSKNPIRKAREILIARRLEAELSKQRILELYLNSSSGGTGSMAPRPRRAPTSASPRRSWGRRSRRCWRVRLPARGRSTLASPARGSGGDRR